MSVSVTAKHTRSKMQVVDLLRRALKFDTVILSQALEPKSIGSRSVATKSLYQPVAISLATLMLQKRTSLKPFKL